MLAVGPRIGCSTQRPLLAREVKEGEKRLLPNVAAQMCGAENGFIVHCALPLAPFCRAHSEYVRGRNNAGYHTNSRNIKSSCCASLPQKVLHGGHQDSQSSPRLAAQSQDSQRRAKTRSADAGLAAQSQDSQRRAKTRSAEPRLAALRAGMFRRRLALRCQPTCNSSFIRNPPLQPAQLFVSNSRPQSMGVRPPRSRCRSSSTLRSRLQENQASHTRGSLMSTIAAARHFRQASG